MTKPTVAVIGVLALLIVGPAQGVEESGWGQLKQLHLRSADGIVAVDLPVEAAAKRPSRVYSATATSESGQSTDATVDLSATQSRSVSRWVYPKGKTQIYLSDLNAGGTLDDDLYVSLAVPTRAVDVPVLVTMTVIGNKLSDLVIVFQPGGLVFNTPASLWVQMGTVLVDIPTSDITVWHEYDDGTVEEASLEATKDYQKGAYEFITEVPGSSRYGLRR